MCVLKPYKYLALTLFLFPSAWEDFQLALCDATICSVTVVSANSPTDPREILVPGTVRDALDRRSAEFAEQGVLMPMIEGTADFNVSVETVQRLLADEQARQRMSANTVRAILARVRDEVSVQWQSLMEKTAHVH